MRLSELMDNEYLGEKSFLSHHVHELIPLPPAAQGHWAEQKAKGAALGGGMHHTLPKPHLNTHFFLSQSFPTHFQFTKLFPQEQKEDPSDCWHLIRAFLTSEALEVRTFLISSTPPSTPEPLHSAALRDSWGQSQPSTKCCTNPSSG